jgi:LacI family transcriptional regulator
LIERGHKRIAMLRAFDGFQPGLERQRGYLRALEEAGIAPDESLMRSVTFGARNIANMVHRLLVDPRVTALVDSSATEDASSLREGMRRAGRTVGNDLDVVAWTYAENGVVLEEAAAHLWLPVRESAAEGFEQLAAWMRGARQEPVHIVYRPVLQAVVSGQPVPRPKRLFEMLE